MNNEQLSSESAPMSGLRTCSGCGASIRPGAPDELCPRCLLGFGLGLNPGQPAPVASASLDPSLPAGLSPTSARSLGDYELLDEIARGGMGIVYRARQRSLNRIVAVKVLLFGQFASTNFIKRFQAEAEAVASLHHPNIVAIHSVGEHEGQHYFAMEYIEGRSLADLARDQPLPARRAATLLKKIADAVDYAHSRGILHRDLKPSNILLDISDEPRVTDFGLAKRLSGDSEITLTGQVLGSPSFMAPEQVSYDQTSVGPASDIYSLGAILYYLLTGRPPFVADTIETTLNHVLNGDPPPPRRLNPGIPIDLETICLKCLERDPRRRYETARDLAHECARFLGGDPIRARPVSAGAKAWRWAARNPMPATLAALLLVVLVAFLVYSVISSTRLRREAERARHAEKETAAELGHSYLAQARAERRSGQAGQRFDSLEAIRKATELGTSLDLRNEAIAALALPDARLTNVWPHPEDVLPLCYGDSLQRYAKPQRDGEISVCRTSDNVEEARLPGIGASVRWIAGFTADETMVAVNYQGDQNCLWDLATRKPLLGPLPGLNCLPLPGIKELVILGSDSMVRFYSCKNFQLLRSWGLSEPLQVIAAPRRPQVIAGFRHGSPLLYLFDFPSGKQRFALNNDSEVGSVAISPDGTLIAVGCHDQRIHLWSAATGLRQAILEGHDNNVVAVDFNHTGSLLASASWDDTTRLWDMSALRQVVAMSGMSYEMRFAPDDSALAHLVRGGVAGILQIAQSQTFHELHPRAGSHREAWSLAFSPDGRLAATAHTDGIGLWDVAQGKEIDSIPTGHGRSVMFSPDGKGLITTGNSLLLFPLKRTLRHGYEEVSIGPPRHIRDGLEFMYTVLSGDGAWVAAANMRAGAIACYEVAHPENRFALTNLPGVQFVSASTDFHWIAGGTWQGRGVKIWDVNRRALERELPIAGTATVAFSPDGKLLATGTGTYEVWEAGSWRKLYEVHKPDVETGYGIMTFSPDGRWLALVEGSRQIVLVEARTGTEIASFNSPRGRAIAALCFTPDGSKLAALEFDQEIQLWDLRCTRASLAALKLDWNDPSFPPATQNGPPPPCVVVFQPFTAEELAEKIPARSPATPSRCIDLSRWFNAPLTESWTEFPDNGNDLRELPRGLQEFCHIPFDVRGLVQTAFPALPGYFPTNVAGIKIEQSCSKLHFLHSTGMHVEDGVQIGRFRVHYANSQETEISLRYGAEVRDWWEQPDEGPLTSPNSSLAWQGHNPHTPASIRIYQTTWENPHPDTPIQSVDFESSLTVASPFLLAITVEQ